MDSRPIKFLLVDDLEENLIALEALLRQDGLELLKARSGAEALELLLLHDVGLALVDVQMPGMDGFELAELMRGTERTRKIPIIFITAGIVDPERHFRGYDAGAVDFLFKPIVPHILLSKTRVFRDLCKQRQEIEVQRDKLSRREMELRHALEASQMGSWVYDRHQHTLELDMKSRELYGLSSSTVIVNERTIRKLVHPDDVSKVLETFEAPFERGGPGRYDLDHRILLLGEVRWLSVSATAVADDEGASDRLIGTSRDITQRKQFEAERAFLLESERVARAEAERANRLKDEFLATLSHELRSPLNAILGWADLLLKGLSDGKKAAEIIRRNAKTQQRLIEDLLDVSRISAGKYDIVATPVLLSEVLKSAIESEAPNVEQKNIVLERYLSEEELWIEGDVSRLQQVFVNLISNAVKFTPEGGTISISASVRGGDIVIRVSDTGQGIEPAFLPYLFERFHQQDASITRKHGGLGLGLSLVKLITELHKGTIQAESEGLGKGATFTLTLPLLCQSNVSEHAETTDMGDLSTALRGTTIAVVDDDEDARALVARILEERGASVRCFGSAEDALSAVREKRPDVVVSDIGMPGKDGYTLNREIRSFDTNLPVIAVTALARPEDQRRVLAEGFVAHVTKPVEAQSLVEAVNEALGS